MRFKVGDRVRIKSLDWYNENKNKYGEIHVGDGEYNNCMKDYCGKVMTIYRIVDNKWYMMEETYIYKPWTDIYKPWTDEMIEGLVEETITINEPLLKPVNISLEKEMEWNLPNGYTFKDENGNVINTTKIVLEKLVVPKFKKGDKIKDKNNRVWYVAQVGNRHFDISHIPDGHGYFVPMEDQDDYELSPDRELPKTFEECVRVLEGRNRMSLELMNTFRKLIDARNAYWTIYGEENGLGKPWEPDYNNEKQSKYGLYDILKYSLINPSQFVFPSEEMRDTFYENFKEEIEKCKKLL